MPDSAKNNAASDTFTTYLGKRFLGDKGFRTALPVEAAALVECCDGVLSYADYGLVFACFLDREADPARRFSISQQALMDVGRACLKYTGAVNGAKMPVGITLYEIGSGPPTDDDCRRLNALQRTLPGFAKVTITCFYLDTRNETVWSSAPLHRLLHRVGHRGWLQSVLREPRKADGEIFAASPALPRAERRPVATVSVLALLAAMFVVEHATKVRHKGAGLLGVDVRTLFALGGMNTESVLKDGEWYRMLSAALLHADAFHLALNGVALGLAGYLLESLLGPAWFVALFFAGAIGGSSMGLLVNPANLVSVGASGAVMALLAAALFAAMRFPRGAARTRIQVQLLQFLIPSLIPLATLHQGGRIDFAAHFGGAIVGAVAGYVLLRIWPKTEEKPRYAGVSKALAAFGFAAFGSSLFFVKGHYSAYAAEAAAAEVLVPDANIPKHFPTAKREVDVWGKDHPRDPRVHLYRALRMIDEKNESAAEAELRAALAEREILDREFGNKKLESGIRSVLCEVLVHESRLEEAKREAQPVCKANDGAAPNELRELGLCD